MATDVQCGAFGGRELRGLYSAAWYEANGTAKGIWQELPMQTRVLENGEKVYTETHGCVFRQLFQDIPALEPLYTTFESDFNALAFVNFAERYMSVAFLICAVYLLACYFGMKVMARREAFTLRGPLVAWNLLLSVFSAIGFLRTAPHLVYYAYSRGFYESVCAPAESSYGQGAAGFWTMLFIFSKVPELVDTAFIVLKKKPLIFLHWYHHVTVLLYCWHSYATRSSAGLYFVAMNYGVHAVMYFYYALAAMRIRVSWDFIVTTLQISQMFVGIAVCASVYVFSRAGRACDITHENFVAGLVMYASYALLFVLFAADKYLLGGGALAKAPKPKTQ